MGLRTLWQRFGGFTAVLMAFALMFGPAADAAICSDEGPPAAAQHADSYAVSTDVAATTADDPANGLTHNGNDAGLCQHGHCHHVATYLPSLVAEVSPHPTVSTPAMKLASQHPRSRAASRLDRPPRA